MLAKLDEKSAALTSGTAEACAAAGEVVPLGDGVPLLLPLLHAEMSISTPAASAPAESIVGLVDMSLLLQASPAGSAETLQSTLRRRLSAHIAAGRQVPYRLTGTTPM
jgi:hypothetical protein